MRSLLGFTRRPVVSVIMTSFNHAPFVVAAVRSVLDQTFTDLELIVVDDASSDGTLAQVTSLKDPRLSVIPMKATRAMNGRNLALRQARGRYVAFQNSDDIWAPAKLERQVELLASQSEAAACFTRVEVIGGDDRPVSGTFLDGLFRDGALPRLEWLRLFFEVGNCLCISSAVVRSDLARSLGGFRGSLIQLGDYDLWIRLATLGELLMVEAPLTRMRHTGANFGGPSPGGQRRAQIEHVDVLMRFAESPLVRQLHHIFPDVVDRRSPPEIAVLALALSCRGRSLRHDLFADRVVARILDDGTARARAVELHGTGFIHDFLAVRAQLETRLVRSGETP